MPIPTSAELDEATAQKFPHYSIQFPKWEEIKNGRLPDNVEEIPNYVLEHHKLSCTNVLHDPIEKLKGRFPDKMGQIDAKRENEAKPNAEDPEPGKPLKMMPHPGSDCRHIDPGQPKADFRNRFPQLMNLLRDLNRGAKGDGELMDKVDRALQSLGDAEELLLKAQPGKPAEPGAKGMQRLKLIFEWALCQVVTVFGEINAALDDAAKPVDATKPADAETARLANAQSAYENARLAYIALLKDLDDREPQTEKDPPEAPPKTGVRGYGRVIKWIHIMPLIKDGRIKGAKVVAKWNPHISSSGIPIPHS